MESFTRSSSSAISSLKPGRYRFIDFHNEDINHLCSWNKKMYLGEVEPDLLKLGCAVLYDIGKTLKVWKPGAYFRVFYIIMNSS